MIRQQHELYLGDPSREHLVQPKMVYISQPTEIGSLYRKEELEELYAVCRHYGLYLFIDGARLGYGLTAPDNDLTLADISKQLRCLLHRRHQMRRAFRRSGSYHQSGSKRRFPHDHEAGRRCTGQRTPAGPAI